MTGWFSVPAHSDANLLATLRMQFFPWVLAAISGTAAAANYQAASNLVQLTNPIILGLCNVIPQVSARGRAGRGSRYAVAHRPTPYMVGRSSGVCLLRRARCSTRQRIAATLWARVCLYASGLGGASDDTERRFHLSWRDGLFLLARDRKVHLAMRINFGGLVASLLLGLPLIAIFGLMGSCLALFATSCLRAAMAYHTLNNVIWHEPRRYA